MQAVLSALKRLWLVLKLFIPEQLPQTDTALKYFMEDICAAGNYPCNASFSQAIATQIMHVDHKRIYVTKYQFIKALRRSIANQAAYSIIEDIKQQDAANKKKQAEALASTMVPEAP